uniref:Uncharacterized protein n=1 Tax=Ixodes ricinus TaxID=34613 RepID=V5IBL4_IXORI
MAVLSERLPVFGICFYVSILHLTHYSECSTHWVVTDKGKIQPQMDSVFSLRRPYDLLALLAQEERAVQVEEFKQQLLRRKQEIDRCEDQASDVEQRLYSTDKDCILAAQPLTDFDLYVSTVVPFDHKIQSHWDKADLRTARAELPEPDCSRVLDLDFSMHSFEHLTGVRERHNLTMSPEAGLHRAVSAIEGTEEFGYEVYKAMAKKQHLLGDLQPGGLLLAGTGGSGQRDRVRAQGAPLLTQGAQRRGPHQPRERAAPVAPVRRGGHRGSRRRRHRARQRHLSLHLGEHLRGTGGLQQERRLLREHAQGSARFPERSSEASRRSLPRQARGGFRSPAQLPAEDADAAAGVPGAAGAVAAPERQAAERAGAARDAAGAAPRV